MLSIVLGELIIINKIDDVEENYGNITILPKKGLPHQIILKINMLVKLYAGNYDINDGLVNDDINDGLVNDADRILKEYTSLNQTYIIWIQFNDINIGQSQSTKLAHLFTIFFSKKWLPIL